VLRIMGKAAIRTFPLTTGAIRGDLAANTNCWTCLKISERCLCSHQCSRKPAFDDVSPAYLCGVCVSLSSIAIGTPVMPNTEKRAYSSAPSYCSPQDTHSTLDTPT